MYVGTIHVKTATQVNMSFDLKYCTSCCLSHGQFNPSGAAAGIIQQNEVDSTIVDELAHMMLPWHQQP